MYEDTLVLEENMDLIFPTITDAYGAVNKNHKSTEVILFKIDRYLCYVKFSNLIIKHTLTIVVKENQS